MLYRIKLLTTLCAAGLAIAASAQQVSFTDIAGGTAAPTSIKISALTNDFKAMRIHSAGEQSQGMMGSLSSMLMMAGAASKNSDQLMGSMMQIGGLGDVMWTKGQTLTLAGHEFLIAYHVNTGIDPASMASGNAKLVADLTLNLIRTDTITTVAPDPNMSPDSLRKTLTAAKVTFDVSPLHTESSGGSDAELAAILFPVFAQAKVAAQETSTLSNLKQIGLAAIMYSIDYDDVLPYVQGTDQFRQVTSPYYKDDSIWKSANPNGGGFRFAMNLAGVSVESVERPSEAPLAYEANPWPDGKRCVVFVDGHAKRMTREEWAQVEPLLQQKYKRTAKRPIK